MALKLFNNTGSTLYFTEWGASLKRWFILDKNEEQINIVLGYENDDLYKTNPLYLGATAGRYANRIKNGLFLIGNKSYQLETNNNGHHLHGGFKGFSRQKWSIENQSNAQITFSLVSPDGDQGYPGKINVQTTYELNDQNELNINYKAISDTDTTINMTHHSYFNLHGQDKDSILDHLLSINADSITEVDTDLIPTGKTLPVNNTPLDFRKPTKIGERINENFHQLRYAGGYDHNFIIQPDNKGVMKLASELVSKRSGLRMTVRTDLPGMQFYSGNFLDGKYNGVSGNPLYKHAGLCLEPQYFPDSPNNEHFPPTIIKKGREYKHKIIYKVSLI